MLENSAKICFLNFRVIWSVDQIALFNGFLSDFVEIISCVYTKTLFFSISANGRFRNIYLDFIKKIVKYTYLDILNRSYCSFIFCPVRQRSIAWVSRHSFPTFIGACRLQRSCFASCFVVFQLSSEIGIQELRLFIKLYILEIIILTGKLCRKFSYNGSVPVNQRSDRSFSRVQKIFRPIRIANDVFSFAREMIRAIKSHSGAEFRAKFPDPVLYDLAAMQRPRFVSHSARNFFNCSFNVP